MYSQVHDYAQLLKECEKQIKLLETATTGTSSVPISLDPLTQLTAQ